MATIRVFLLTCRRPTLLPRALASLRQQTFSDWVCELHNDAPEDRGPAELLQKLGDPRFILCRHETSWGAVAAFNHAYAGGPEPFAAILEDDNWWEPEFLARAHAALAAQPAANVCWANLRLWQEAADGEWRNTGRKIWDTADGDTSPRLFFWPQPLQCFDALHSHGAMVFRAEASRAALVPAETPLAIIEPARERLLAGGWLLLPAPLANFALTLRTARSRETTPWSVAQLLVAGSYLTAHPVSPLELAELWQRLRAQRPPSTPLLFHLAFARIRTWALLRHARPEDWMRFLAGAVRHPVTLLRALRFRSTQPALWRLLCAGAEERSRESVNRPPGLAVFEKRLTP